MVEISLNNRERFTMHIFMTLSILMASITLGSLSAFAQKEEKIKTEETPISIWIKAENEMIDSLPKQNQQVFFVMRDKYNAIQSVRMVQRDVGNAVKSCAIENKELSTDIETRYKEWNGIINPILDDASKFLKKELKEQEAFYESDFNKITKLNDKAFLFSENKVEKTPITTLKACKALMKSMDRTEDKLVNLMQDILLPEEVVRKRLERAKK